MKTIKYIVLIIVLAAVISLTTTDAMARGYSGHSGRSGHSGHTSVRIGVGFGYPYSYHYGYGPRYGYYNRYSYYPYPYSYYPYYHPYAYPYDYPEVIVERPIVVQRPPVVITQPAPVQVYSVPAVQTSDEFADVRMKKTELLNKLASSDKAEKMKAISDLGGLSYDDEVSAKLTEILLKDPDADLRIGVIKAFASVKNQKAIFTLEGVRITDDNKDVRQAADDAIRQIKG